MTPRLCAFDLDGTLVDTVRDICLHVNRALAALDQPTHPEEDVRRHIGHGATELMRGVLGPSAAPLLPRAVSLFRDSYDADPVVHSTLFPGGREALLELRAQGITCAVVTNKPRDISVKLLESLGVLDLLACVEGPDGSLPLKPDPTMLKRAADCAGAPAASVVMVGDSTIDAHTAAAFGCAFVGVTFGMDGGAGLRGLGIAPHPSLAAATRDVLGRLGGSA